MDLKVGECEATGGVYQDTIERHAEAGTQGALKGDIGLRSQSGAIRESNADKVITVAYPFKIGLNTDRERSKLMIVSGMSASDKAFAFKLSSGNTAKACTGCRG